MNAPGDLDVNCGIRKVLIKHWIDIGRLSIRTSHGEVTIHGLLDTIPGVEERLTAETVGAIFTQIKRLSGVKKLTLELTNWVAKKRRWVEIHSTDTTAPLT